MEKEKMQLIEDKADELAATYRGIWKTAKKQGDTITAYAYMTAENTVKRLMAAINTLNEDNLI